MFINEIPVRSFISIKTIIGYKEVEMFSTVLNSTLPKGERSVCVEPFLEDIETGEDGKKGVVYFYSTEENICLCWKDVEIKREAEKYILSDPNPGAVTDRRGSFRLLISIPCQVIIRHGQDGKSGLIHDMSISGIAFDVDPQDVSYTKIFNKMVNLSFIDSQTSDEFDLSCICKNVRGMDDGKLRCGCAIMKSNINLAHYIRDKQLA